MAARRLHALVYGTIASCCLIIIICGVSLGTDQWFSSEALLNYTATTVTIKLNVGLFKGQKTREPLSPGTYSLKLVCSSSKCMYSCGRTAELRKQDLEDIISGIPKESDAAICRNEDASETVLKRGNVRQGDETPGEVSEHKHKDVFINFGLYIVTIAFIVLAMAFAALGGGLALYNTYRTPIQPILSIFGLYVWNGITASCILLTMIMWGVNFSTSLNKNAGIFETHALSFDSEGNGSLGFSFWILIIGLLLPLFNIGLLAYRSWKITKMEETNIKVMTEQLETGDILLF